MNAGVVFQYFIIAGLINVSLFGFLLVTRKKNSAASFLLVIFMLLISFQALLNAFDTREFFLANPHLSRISWLLPSVFGPLVYLFARKIIHQQHHLEKEDGIHFIPFAFYFGALSPWFFSPGEQKVQLLSDFSELSKQDFGFLNQLSLVIILFYLILTLIELRAYQREIENTFSEISTRRLQWIRTFVYSMLAILIISALGFFGRKWGVPFFSNFYHYNYGLLVMLVYWMAYKCILQPDLYLVERGPTTAAITDRLPVALDHSGPLTDNLTGPREPGNKKYQKSGLNNEAAARLYSRLLDYMESNRPYIEPDLSIYKVAEYLDSPRHHLSQVINEHAQKTFYDFVNSYRVEEVKKKLANPAMANRNILGIALDCGFNSKATFNAAFKKYTGMTPSAYQKTRSETYDQSGTVDSAPRIG
ncbi:MAG TPA: AraC family transcriptional regulator [Flavitalea sp.]|nr:AraC family transcriptional regulator [Flavitalea sp.]